MFDFKINIGHCDLYFMFQWFSLISWSLFDVWTSYFRIMNQYDTIFDLKINVGHCDLYFMVQWFCHILKTIWYINTILWDYESIWSDVWPKKNVGHCDLYFMVQWFCLISWKLFSRDQNIFSRQMSFRKATKLPNITCDFIDWMNEELHAHEYSLE